MSGNTKGEANRLGPATRASSKRAANTAQEAGLEAGPENAAQAKKVQLAKVARKAAALLQKEQEAAEGNAATDQARAGQESKKTRGLQQKKKEAEKARLEAEETAAQEQSLATDQARAAALESKKNRNLQQKKNEAETARLEAEAIATLLERSLATDQARAALESKRNKNLQQKKKEAETARLEAEAIAAQERSLATDQARAALESKRNKNLQQKKKEAIIARLKAEAIAAQERFLSPSPTPPPATAQGNDENGDDSEDDFAEYTDDMGSHLFKPYQLGSDEDEGAQPREGDDDSDHDTDFGLGDNADDRGGNEDDNEDYGPRTIVRRPGPLPISSDDENTRHVRAHDAHQGSPIDLDEQDTSDEDTEQQPMSKKRRTALGVQFQVSKPTNVASKLPGRRRKRAGPISSIDGPRTTPTPTAPNQQFTPYKPKAAGSKVSMGPQSPASTAILKTANIIFRVYLSTRNAFPNTTQKEVESKRSFRQACDKDGLQSRKERLAADAVYSLHMSNVIGQRVSQLRSEFKVKAQNQVMGGYGINSKLGADRVKVIIAGLLDKGNFTFADIPNRKQPFKNEIFPIILQRQCFATKTSDGVQDYAEAYNPIPLQLIAFIATAVEAALRDWSTGVCNAKINHFEEHVYGPVYTRHVKNLEIYKEKCPNSFRDLQEDLYKRAWELSSVVRLEVVADDYLEGFDFEAEEAEHSGPQWHANAVEGADLQVGAEGV